MVREFPDRPVSDGTLLTAVCEAGEGLPVPTIIWRRDFQVCIPFHFFKIIYYLFASDRNVHRDIEEK